MNDLGRLATRFSAAASPRRDAARPEQACTRAAYGRAAHSVLDCVGLRPIGAERPASGAEGPNGYSPRITAATTCPPRVIRLPLSVLERTAAR